MNIPGHPTAQHTLRLLLLCLGMLLSVASGGALAAPKPPNALDDPVSRFRDSLDRDEIAWLAAHPEIRVGNGPDFQPFYAWKGTQYTGPSADYLDLLSRRTGLRFRLQRFADFPAVLNALQRGEIDLILRERDGTVVFVEVRSRSSNAFGGAGSSIGAIKQQRVVFAARHYLLRYASPPPCRFDAVLIEGQVQWIKAAFDAQ